MVIDGRSKRGCGRTGQGIAGVALLPDTRLSDAAVGVVVGVGGAHFGVFHGHEAVFEVPGAGQAVDVGHVAVGVVGIVASGALASGECGQRVGAGWVAGGAAGAVPAAGGAAGVHVAEVGHGQALFHVVGEGAGLGEHVADAVIAVVDLAVVAAAVPGSAKEYWTRVRR